MLNKAFDISFNDEEKHFYPKDYQLDTTLDNDIINFFKSQKNEEDTCYLSKKTKNKKEKEKEEIVKHTIPNKEKNKKERIEKIAARNERGEQARAKKKEKEKEEKEKKPIPDFIKKYISTMDNDNQKSINEEDNSSVIGNKKDEVKNNSPEKMKFQRKRKKSM